MPKSREQISHEADALAKVAVHCAYRLHCETGPGLLESVYEVVLAKMLADQGIHVERQTPIPIQLMGATFTEGFRADLLLNKTLLIELKSVEKLQRVHSKQTLTYLRLLDLPLGLLINFGASTLKEGVNRVVNNYKEPPPSLQR
jgi:GxxExxY protein